MPINNQHKKFIESIIHYYFDFDDLISEENESKNTEQNNLAEKILTKHIKLIVEAIDQEIKLETHDYQHFSKFFHDPEALKRIRMFGEITKGEVKEHMVIYVDQRIKQYLESNIGNGKAFDITKKLQNLGWDKDAILLKIRQYQDHEITMVKGEEKEGKNPMLAGLLQGRNAVFGIGPARLPRKISRNDLILEKLKTGNGLALKTSGLLTDEAAIKLGLNRTLLLVTDRGRQLLEGNPPKLTTDNAAKITPQCISAMIDCGLSFEQVSDPKFNPFIVGYLVLKRKDPELVNKTYDLLLGLENHQIEAIFFGLSKNMVIDKNFTSYTLSSIKTLMQGKVKETLEDAYNYALSLNFYQADGRRLGLSHEEVVAANFSEKAYNNFVKLRSSYTGISREDAYKYSLDSTDSQIKGMCCGLSYKQVCAANFGFHTLDAIDALLARHGYLYTLDDGAYKDTLDRAYELVAGMDIQGINDYFSTLEKEPAPNKEKEEENSEQKWGKIIEKNRGGAKGL